MPDLIGTQAVSDRHAVEVQLAPDLVRAVTAATLVVDAAQPFTISFAAMAHEVGHRNREQ
jgi:hypothetical protein